MKNYLNNWESHFKNHRPYLVAFSYRMTGSLAEAEELVQETFLACTAVNPEEINNHRSFLTKICSNKCLDHLKSAYKKRETYVGSWLPDAVPDSFHHFDQSLILNESLTTTFLLLIEKLSPEERVVYILSEVFEYTYSEIAEFLNKSVEALRKIAQRARSAIASQKIKYDSNSIQAQNLIVEFFEIVKRKDKAALMALLSEDSEFWSDGGGKVNAIRVVIKNNEQIVRFFSSEVIASIYSFEGLKIETGRVNTLPGIMISKQLSDGSWHFDTIMNFEIKDNKIARIYSQRNPDKLNNLLH
jgi:RNA polymerase sigma-70 factor (ECF subfamily)